MDEQLESPSDDIARLRGCLNDLASILAPPVLAMHAGPAQVVELVLDALLKMLDVAFVFIRLNDHENEPAAEWARVTDPLEPETRPRNIGAMLEQSLGGDQLKWLGGGSVFFGDLEVSAAGARLGDLGIVVVGSPRTAFPAQIERLVLDSAANQAAVGLHQAHERSARAAFREAKRQTELIMDAIPGLVATLKASGEVEAVNRGLVEYCGKSLNELQQWGTSGVIHPDDLPSVVEAFSQQIETGQPVDLEMRIRRVDGVFHWFRRRSYPFRDSSGRITGWYLHFADIDDLKRAEQARRASDLDLKLIVDTIPGLAWSARPDGTAEFFSKNYLDFLGLSAEQAQGWGWSAALHPDDMKALAAAWQRILASEAPGEAEARLRRSDGEYRWFLFRARPLRDESGAIVKWYGLNTDIEDRKRAEAELRQAYDSFSDAQRLSRTGSFITDIVANNHKWSAEAFRIFEFDPAIKVSVEGIREIVHPDDLQLFDSVIQGGMAGKEVDFVFRIRTAKGVKHVRSIARVVEYVAGRPLFVGALQDLTEIKAAEEALDRARSDLAHVVRISSLNAMTASIAHEINQPLAGIITNASTSVRMLDADPPNIEGARETARRTIRDANRASDVTTRLRALFSKGKFTLETLDLNEATREVIALSSSDLQRNGVVLRSELDEELPRVIGDRVQLQQVVLNLIRNAADAMAGIDDRPRQLLIKTEREKNEGVRLSVRDAGVGIDRQSLDKLFDAFYTTKSGGMGVGLSVSRSIVERHHGRIWAESNDGPGATFGFSIPHRPAQAS